MAKILYGFFVFAAIFLCASAQFKLILQAFKRQQGFQKQWNNLLLRKEIIQEIDNQNRPLFRMTGDKVREMRVQDVFGMLQNGHTLIQSGKSSQS